MEGDGPLRPFDLRRGLRRGGLRRLARGPPPPVQPPSRRRKGGNHPFPPLSIVYMGWGKRSLRVGLPPPLLWRGWGSFGAPHNAAAAAA
ncbi:hypothetical protein Sjap_001758 [Stephania japonica]|uniref:Uncharacterized protein n=1 Tax=Stephania japonica TaxID=461633 RepID=A0AAP0KM43_9MAGN